MTDLPVVSQLHAELNEAVRTDAQRFYVVLAKFREKDHLQLHVVGKPKVQAESID